jgi:tricarballylate dehydrogenase
VLATWDILVIGGGVAGLSAAIAARRRGASVQLIESAPRALRGGNARHARNFRISHERSTWYAPDAYTADEFMSELLKVSGGELDREIAWSLIRDTADIAPWLMECGVRLQDPRVGTVPYSRRTAFLLGGGKAMMNALYDTAERIGVAVAYDCEGAALAPEPDGGWSVDMACGDERRLIASRCVIVAAGGPGGDPDWLRARLGPAADGYCIRGGSYSDGRAMQRLLDAGARGIGDPTTCHVVAVDARGPKFDGGIVTRVTAIPYGLVVDQNADPVTVASRDTGRSRYARWGPRIAACPGGVAFLILDAVGLNRAAPTALPPVTADSIAALAEALALDGAALGGAVDAFNAERGSRRPSILTPPFFAFPLRPGLTFVHYGLAVDDRMRVTMADGRGAETLFAAGMIMAANVLRRGYLAGFGITLSAVTGRRAGEAAARHVLG